MTAPPPNCTESTYNVISKLSFAGVLRDRQVSLCFLSDTPPSGEQIWPEPLLSCSLGAVLTPTQPVRGMRPDCTIQNIVLAVQ